MAYIREIDYSQEFFVQAEQMKPSPYAKMIGLVFDYVDDGRVDGVYTGEFLLCTPKYVCKVGGLDSFCMPQGPYSEEKAAIAAVGLIYDIYKENAPKHLEMLCGSTEYLHKLENIRLKQYERAADMRCFFDAAAFLIGLPGEKLHQAAEQAFDSVAEGYEFNIRFINGKFVIGTKDILMGILADRRGDEQKSVMAAKFYKSIVEACLFICNDLRELNGIGRVFIDGRMFREDSLLADIGYSLLADRFRIEDGLMYCFNREARASRI